MGPAPLHRTVPSRTMRYGDHALLLYSSPRERTDAVVPFVLEGLRRNDRVLCVGGGIGAACFDRLGTRASDALKSGQIVLEDSSQTYMRGGEFSGKRMKAHYRDASERAITDGFNGLRVAAEMSWAAHAQAQPLLPLAEYEATLEDALRDEPVMVVCEYDVRLFDTSALGALEQAHPITARPDPVFASQRLWIERAYEPNGLVFTGELDVASRDALRDALHELVDSGADRPVVDLRALSYVDAGSVGALVAAAQQNESGLEIVVNPQIARTLRVLRMTLPASVEIREDRHVL